MASIRCATTWFVRLSSAMRTCSGSEGAAAALDTPPAAALSLEFVLDPDAGPDSRNGVVKPANLGAPVLPAPAKLADLSPCSVGNERADEPSFSTMLWGRPIVVSSKEWRGLFVWSMEDAVLSARLPRCLSGIRIVNVLPCPSIDLRLIPPLINVDSCEQMLSPRPVPLYFLLNCMSPWKNGSKILFCRCSGTPGPVSCTTNSNVKSRAETGGPGIPCVLMLWLLESACVCSITLISLAVASILLLGDESEASESACSRCLEFLPEGVFDVVEPFLDTAGSPSPTHLTVTVTEPPVGVNFKAFEVRFMTTWRIRDLSPQTIMSLTRPVPNGPQSFRSPGSDVLESWGPSYSTLRVMARSDAVLSNIVNSCVLMSRMRKSFSSTVML